MASDQVSQSKGTPKNETIQPSSRAEIDQALAVLSAHKDAWAAMDIPGRLALLKQIKRDLPRVEKRWITAGTAAKEGRLGTMVEGEEWYSITAIYRYNEFIQKALKDIQKYGKPKIPGKVTTRPDGQMVAQVVPHNWKEMMALPGFRAEVWMDPSVSQENGGIPQAAYYHSTDKKGGVCVVLGAGNIGALVPGDFMHKLFVEGQVVALKMNPVNQYLGPFIEEGFSALIKSGFLQVLYGGGEVGSYLVNHPAVDNIHMTGTHHTYEAIVFGAGAEGQQRKKNRQPHFTKPFSGELGNVSPVIVIPGPWSEKELKNQAARIGSWLMPNSACNCLTPRLIIQMKNWEHHKKLNDGIANFLDGMGTRKAYYPNSFEVAQKITDAHPDALKLGKPKEGHLPWIFIPDVDPSKEDDICFTTEPFLSLFSETSLEANDIVDFIGKAVEFANEKVWGNLIATIVVHPKSMKDPLVGPAVRKAIADLRYGSIVINHWGAIAHYMTNTPWGAYPGNDIYDIQSGVGFVNNPLMFDRPQKSVIYTAFTPIADPFLMSNRKNHLWLSQDARYHYAPNMINLTLLGFRAMTLK